MADIYVDPDSATNGTGSYADPRNIWPTGVGANDVIHLKGGTRLVVAAQLGMGAGSNNVVKGYYPQPAPKPIITSTATNQSLIFIARPGVTEFNGIHFDQCLTMSANGGVIGTGDNGSGRYASLNIRNCKFTGTGQNAILLNSTTTANAALTFRAVGNEFDDIGADCVFGAALNYEFAHNRCTRISSRTANGDAVGFITADPDLVWVHDNYIDHSDVDAKQCIIIDTTTPGTGLCVIENNTLIGYGNASAAPSLHTVIISDPVTKIRRNIICTAGLACGVNTATDEVTDNLFIVSNGPSFDHTMSMSADGLVAHNTFINTNPSLRSTHSALVIGASVSSAGQIKANLFVGFPNAIRTGSAALPDTLSNAYWQCVRNRWHSTDYPETSEVLTDPLLGARYRPQAGSPLALAGFHRGYVLDLAKRLRHNPPSIGAYEAA